MYEKKRYTLPTQAGKQLFLGQLNGTASTIECAEIIKHHYGLTVIITTDMQSTLLLHDEIRQFTNLPILTLPDWETLPYDNFSPYQEIISNRLSTLYHLPTMERGVIILPINSLLHLVCPYSFLLKYSMLIKKGQQLSREYLCNQLKYIGYQNVHQVMEYGEFSIHNTLLDIYSMGNENPYRINFLNDTINNLRIFNVDTQRTLDEILYLNLLPAHEFPTDKAAINIFRNQWRKQFNVGRDEEHIYQQISKGILPAGIEYWQPLFFNKSLVPIFNYLPKSTLLINTSNLEDCANRFWKNTLSRYDNRCVDSMRPLLPPETMWLHTDSLFDKLKQWPRVELRSERLPDKIDHINMNYQSLPDISIETHSKTPIEKLRCFCETFNGQIIFSVESEGRRETMRELLAQINIQPVLINRLEEANNKGNYLLIGTSEYGVIDVYRGRALICERDLLGKQISRRRQENCRTIHTDNLIHNFTTIHEGQPVVHLEHGVGRYAGMTILEAGGIKAEYLILTYANNDKLYVPVSSLHLINRYIGGIEEQAPLHKLGGDSWKRIRQKAAKQINDMAAELLDIYAQRAAKNGFTFHQNQNNYQLFCKEFPFEPTVDQEQAINAVLSDMCQPLAMDRLICGDVGFGKTEVAMRAAFLAIENYKQVALLVPTTLLAQQHFDNFRDRFSKWPVRIEMISRFRSARDQNYVLEKIAAGKINILIGTHKLLQKKIKWHDLGLLIVDEEHRFGVKHKERIKAIHTDVDILTLTATPIPRTLNMAMSGIRDISIIATPPARRLAVKTCVHEYDTLVIREAILREILRGGQVYYLYNDVENIDKTAHYLKTLVPEARIMVGHGQMRERDLERVMNDFHHKRVNVLVCTTIIETGIDIANANTIIIERADNFGLAQLHQLRGRVGRSHHQAYAYLLTPPPNSLKQAAHKRLEAIHTLEDLGAGFALATHDLEIRGAGKLLGEDQSGQMESIGFSLYIELLESAVEALKSGREPSLKTLTNQLTEIEIRIPALLPDNYIPDVNIRLSFYKRIASATNNKEIEQLKIELIDRFGRLPDPARYLLTIADLRQRAHSIGIKRIEGNNIGGFIEFNEYNKVDPDYLINLIQKDSNIYRLDSPNRLKFTKNLSDYTLRLQYINYLLNEFYQHRMNT